MWGGYFAQFVTKFLTDQAASSLIACLNSRKAPAVAGQGGCVTADHRADDWGRRHKGSGGAL
jgi:hypothetical protein